MYDPYTWVILPCMIPHMIKVYKLSKYYYKLSNLSLQPSHSKSRRKNCIRFKRTSGKCASFLSSMNIDGEMLTILTNVTNATIIATLWADGKLCNEEAGGLGLKSWWLANFYFLVFDK